MRTKIRSILSIVLALAACVGFVACSAVKNESANSDETDTKNNASVDSANVESYIAIDDVAPDQNEQQELATIEFPTMKAFKDALTLGTLTEAQKKVIATAFKKDENGNVLLCDLDNLFVPVFPEDGIMENVVWGGGNNYSFEFTFGAVFGWFHYLSETDYNERYQKDYLDLFEKENVNVTATEKIDENKTAVYYSTKTGDLKNVRYTLCANGKTFVVDKTYRLRMHDAELETSSDVPSGIKLYCTEGEVRYVVSLYGFVEEPSDEWIFSFGIEKFIDR